MNLLKYWILIDQGAIKKPVRLLHMWGQGSANDYTAHHLGWQFLDEKMREVLGERFASVFMTYRHDSPLPKCIEPALALFENWLSNPPQSSP
jgi:hypothetical protein